MATLQVFDAKIAAWKQEQDEPLMRLRYDLVQHNLQRHILGGRLDVLDVGGGNGLDSLPLATQGHAVTLFDASTQMLADAERRVKEAGLADRVRLVQGELATVGSLFPEPTFDLVLCHNVLQYLDNAADALRSVCSLLRPGGQLSVIVPNPASEALFVALQELDLRTALTRLDPTSGFYPVFGVVTRRYTVQQIEQWIQAVGCTLVAQYGIHSVSKYIAADKLKDNPTLLDDLVRLEFAMSDRYPYYLIARLMHLIAKKHAPA